jgi:transglutaminase-like putative cysteine protease
MTTVTAPARRAFLKTVAATSTIAAVPSLTWAQSSPSGARQFAPEVGDWRTFDVTTRVDIQNPQGATRLWLPVPSVNTDWQRSLMSNYSSNGNARIADEKLDGTRMLFVEFADGQNLPYVELTSRVQTLNRKVDWKVRQAATLDAAAVKYWTAATDLLPTDGVVRETALDAIQGAKTDVEKVQQLYQWVVTNTHREPKVLGCGEGDIKTMLETGNLGGKCADLNGLFVGLCRAVGIPARDVYGLRVATSAFGYKELGGNPASLKGAQHCRSEVFLKGHGWVAMDPADVAKVMRQETAEWIKTPDNAIVAPVNKALFGGWEGNWIAYNMAHDLQLPNAKGPQLGFLMYPIAENDAGRLNSYAPDDFKYQISAREIKA